MGKFIQTIYELFQLLFQAVRGIVSLFKNDSPEVKEAIKSSRSCKDFSKWKYILIAILVFIAGMFLILYVS